MEPETVEAAQITPLLIKVVSVCLITLVGVVGTFWKLILDRTKRTEAKLDQCELKHEEAHKEYTELAVKLGVLEGKLSGMSTVQELSESVVREIQTGNDAVITELQKLEKHIKPVS